MQAIDAGTPVQQTATATVSVFVEDVNNKPPKFTEESYVQYIPESKSKKFQLFNYYYYFKYSVILLLLLIKSV